MFENNNGYIPRLKFSGKEREKESQLDYFGARYYDNKSSRFLSVDPIINKDEALVNPQLWNLYSYCRNNPVTFLDPDGRKFVYVGSGQFKTNIDIIKSYLGSSPIARAIIQEAENMSATITVIESSMSAIHKEGTIWFDPLAGLALETGEIQSPAMAFLHEVAHALQYRKKTAEFKTATIDPTGDNYDTREEKRVITQIETPVARRLGEPTRRDHRGEKIRVSSPSFHRTLGRKK